MNQQEAAKVIFLLSTNYKNFPEQGKEEALTLLWSMTFQDIPYKLVETAAVKHMMSSKFAPTLQDMMEQLNEITDTPKLTADEAWGEFLRCVRMFGYMREKEALESLTEDVRAIVERFGYANLCKSENSVADRSQFIKAYQATMERKKQQNLMPVAIKNRIEAQQKLMIEGE
jgi:hypothetical protein